MKKYWSLFVFIFFAGILSAQTIVSIAPDSARKTETLNTSIMGSGTSWMFASSTSVYLRQSSYTINATSHSALSQTNISADFTIPGGAPLGLYDVHVDADYDFLKLTSGFMVLDTLTSIDINLLKSLVKLYPNPVEHFLAVDIEDAQLKTVKVYDASGQIFFQHDDPQRQLYSVDFSMVPAGIYSVVVETNKGSFTRKISVLHKR